MGALGFVERLAFPATWASIAMQDDPSDYRSDREMWSPIILTLGSPRASLLVLRGPTRLVTMRYGAYGTG